MMKTTESAIRAIAATDPSITPEQLKAGLDALSGKTATGLMCSAPIDRVLSPKQVAEILGCTRKTVLAYARRKLIRPIGTADSRGYFRRYSEASVRAFLAGNVEPEGGETKTK